MSALVRTVFQSDRAANRRFRASAVDTIVAGSTWVVTGKDENASEVVLLRRFSSLEHALGFAAQMLPRRRPPQSSQNDLTRSGDNSVYRTVC
jgi:hypothetical protein